MLLALDLHFSFKLTSILTNEYIISKCLGDNFIFAKIQSFQEMDKLTRKLVHDTSSKTSFKRYFLKPNQLTKRSFM